MATQTPLTSRTAADSRFITLIIAGVALIGILSVGALLLSRQDKASALTTSGEVSITADGFSPASIRVKEGSSVTWNNRGDDLHQIEADNRNLGLDSEEPLETGDAFSYKFTKVGTYTYHDTKDPAKFQGTVIVE